MIKKLLVFLLLIISSGYYGCSQNTEQVQKRIMVIIEDRLAPSLEQSIEQYKKDLEKEGYNVLIKKDISSTISPHKIRKILQEEYDENENERNNAELGHSVLQSFTSKGEVKETDNAVIEVLEFDKKSNVAKLKVVLKDPLINSKGKNVFFLYNKDI